MTLERFKLGVKHWVGTHPPGPAADRGTVQLPLGHKSGRPGSALGTQQADRQPQQVLTSFCSCKRAMLMWVRVGSASLRSAALRGNGQRRKAQVWGATRSGHAASARPDGKAALDCLPNTSPFLKQSPYSIRAPVIWDRGCLHVQKENKPGDNASL